ncbi:hypothetical protein EVAR_42739_1 [Eumeta japonica]|uniref:Uncharacterized protein n=1 Tax=Eumeta variegata TaxID=151549 RepID=A0A4C1XK90_EUMVA|nr:hypothetical protein EVAR_42739_1 [Eumeta japonica]
MMPNHADLLRGALVGRTVERVMHSRLYKYVRLLSLSQFSQITRSKWTAPRAHSQRSLPLLLLTIVFSVDRRHRSAPRPTRL